MSSILRFLKAAPELIPLVSVISAGVAGGTVFAGFKLTGALRDREQPSLYNDTKTPDKPLGGSLGGTGNQQWTF